MTAEAYVGASHQCCNYARALLAETDRVEQHSVLRRAVRRGVLYHLEDAFLMHLRGLAESYVPGAGASIRTPRELTACLEAAGINSPEAGEVSNLAGDQRSWLRACLEACNALHFNDLDRTGPISSGGDIPLYQDRSMKQQEPSRDLLQGWVDALSELIDRHCVLMAES